ncbi:MAG: hypothetical protein K2P57_07840 [Burkholderiales bacterium]|nr:hypothetical protein [Burkholderiales bacterium]
MPSVLLHDAMARNCGPIKDFFDRDGITLPPFFFDEQPENREYSAAYVCERKKQYFLVLLAADSGGTCKQRELGLGRTMPGGLGVFPRRLPLSVFRTFDNAKLEIKNRDASKSTQFRPLVIDYDGVQRVFYCYEGQWSEARFD